VILGGFPKASGYYHLAVGIDVDSKLNDVKFLVYILIGGPGECHSVGAVKTPVIVCTA
jgi:hypothetical protein